MQSCRETLSGSRRHAINIISLSRDSYSGSTRPCQGRGEGSIPLSRSSFLNLTHRLSRDIRTGRRPLVQKRAAEASARSDCGGFSARARVSRCRALNACRISAVRSNLPTTAESSGAANSLHSSREQLGHRVYDPAEDEKKNLTEEECAHFRDWKTTDLERFRRVVRKIIAFDLDLIENKADYLICYWDGERRAERRNSGRTHRRASKGHSRLSGFAAARGTNQRMDAGVFRPGFRFDRAIERISRRALRPRKANAALERLIESARHRMEKIIIAVGSTRKPKVEAVRDALAVIGHSLGGAAEFEIAPVEVPSGVRHTPLSREDLMAGARQRAEALAGIARETHASWKYFVGLEGGLDVIRDGATRWVFLESWAYVADDTGRGAFGQSSAVLVPERLAKIVVDDGVELSEAIDDFAGGLGIRDAQGAWGVLTRNMITRRDAFRAAVINAFAPFFNREMYSNAERKARA